MGARTLVGIEWGCEGRCRAAETAGGATGGRIKSGCDCGVLNSSQQKEEGSRMVVAVDVVR